MTDLQKAKMKRNIALLELLESYKKTFENDNEFVYFYDKLAKDHKKAVESELEISKDDMAFNLDKAKLKKEVSMLASHLCAVALDAFKEWNEKNLLKGVKFGYLHFSRCNDFITEERVKKVHQLLHKEIESLSPNYITHEQLGEFKDKIKEFVDTPGSSSIVDRPLVELTTKFRADLKLTDVDTRYILKKIETYKNKHKDFYDGIVNITTLPPMEDELTTTVTFLITDSKTGLPLQNVSGILDKSEETPFSDIDGKLAYVDTKAGRGIATFILDGYHDNVSIVKIKAAVENIFEIAMEKL